MEAPPGKSWSYFFDKPAKVWEETLPLGNGRIGLMPDGQINKENIVLNEISMWSGSKQDTDNTEAYKSLAQIRKLLFEGKNDEAQYLMYKTFVCKGQGSGKGNGADTPYGSYQLLGNLVIEYQYPNETDTIFTNEDVTMVVDSLSFQYLVGSEVDYVESLQGSQFLIKNPNATTTCGCGSSFSV